MFLQNPLSHIRFSANALVSEMPLGVPLSNQRILGLAKFMHGYASILCGNASRFGQVFCIRSLLPHTYDTKSFIISTQNLRLPTGCALHFLE